MAPGAAWSAGGGPCDEFCGAVCGDCAPVVAARTAAVSNATAAAEGSREVIFTCRNSFRGPGAGTGKWCGCSLRDGWEAWKDVGADLRLRGWRQSFAVEGFRSGDKAVSSDRKAQGQLGSVTDADASCHQHATCARSVVAQLQWRLGIDQIQSIVRAACNPQRLAQPAGAAGQPSQVAPSFSSGAQACDR